MLFIGPHDMSASLGKLNQFDDPEVLAMVARTEARIIASGKYLASALYADRSVSDMLRSHYRLLVVGSDTSYLIRGSKGRAEGSGDLIALERFPAGVDQVSQSGRATKQRFWSPGGTVND